LETKMNELERLRSIANKDAEIADKDTEIARLKAQIESQKK